MYPQPLTPEAGENLRIVKFEVHMGHTLDQYMIRHLSAPYQPADRQNPQSIQSLVAGLAP